MANSTKHLVINIEKETLINPAYRRVVWTGNNMQLVLMSLKPGEAIDMEIHPTTDQFIRVEAGNVQVLIGDSPSNTQRFIEYDLYDGDIIIVPRNHYHKITNIGPDELKLYTIYTPPNHPANLIQMNKPLID